jgi:hypothetical protein
MKHFNTIQDFMDKNNLQETNDTIIYFEVFEDKTFEDKYIFIPNADRYFLSEEEEMSIIDMTSFEVEVIIQDTKGVLISLEYNV